MMMLSRLFHSIYIRCERNDCCGRFWSWKLEYLTQSSDSIVDDDAVTFKNENIPRSQLTTQLHNFGVFDSSLRRY